MSWPAFKGGQGRSGHQVRQDGMQLFWTLVLVIVVVGALLCSRF